MKKVKKDHRLSMLMEMILCFFLFVLKQVNAVVVAKLCVLDVAISLSVKVFNLMSRTNETKYIEWHEMHNCKRRLNGSGCNNKQRWNDDKCKCECKELIDKGVCDKGSIRNPNNCECDKSCDIDKYLDYENCKCRLAKITLNENKNSHKCSSCTLYIVLFSIIFTINVGSYLLYFYRYLKKDVIRVKFGIRTQITI